MGWLLVGKHPKLVEAEKKLNLDDIMSDPIVAFQDSIDPYFSLFMCFVFPTFVPWYMWNERFVQCFLVVACFRYCFVLHCTWLVNSAAHLYGGHPYDQSINPAENKLVAVLSIGEGWHNWHHTFPYDYAASEFGPSTQFNLTKIFIDICAWAGLVSERKRALNAWANIKAKQHMKAQ